MANNTTSYFSRIFFLPEISQNAMGEYGHVFFWCFNRANTARNPSSEFSLQNPAEHTVLPSLTCFTSQERGQVVLRLLSITHLFRRTPSHCRKEWLSCLRMAKEKGCRRAAYDKQKVIRGLSVSWSGWSCFGTLKCSWHGSLSVTTDRGLICSLLTHCIAHSLWPMVLPLGHLLCA